MYTSEDVLRAAREIRDQLPELLGEEYTQLIDQPLLDLLIQADDGQPVDNQILELLASQEATRLWMLEFLKKENKLPADITKDVTRGGWRPPGNIFPPTENGDGTNPYLYFCPHLGCNYTWERSDIAEPVGTCPIHDCELVQKISLNQNAD
ncbi:MAG: hypothetical protein ACAF41_02480 [Leptolyngbya sp. BL-A-14]